MPLFRFVPTTHGRDPRWLDRPRYEEVVVRAPTAGEARRLAATLDAPATTEAMTDAVGNGAEPRGGALDDEKLYRMDTVAEEDATFLARLDTPLNPKTANNQGAVLFTRNATGCPDTPDHKPVVGLRNGKARQLAKQDERDSLALRNETTK